MDKDSSTSMTGTIVLRDVLEADLPLFYEHQLDEDAARMADFPSRDYAAFMAHWKKMALPFLPKRHRDDVAGKSLNTKDTTPALADGAREYTKGGRRLSFMCFSFVTFVSFVFKNGFPLKTVEAKRSILANSLVLQVI